MKTIFIKDAIYCNSCAHKEVCKFKDQLTKESIRLLDFLEVKCKHYESLPYIQWIGNGETPTVKLNGNRDIPIIEEPMYPTTPIEFKDVKLTNTAITTTSNPDSDSNIQLFK